jgi:hypothetical protein
MAFKLPQVWMLAIIFFFDGGFISTVSSQEVMAISQERFYLASHSKSAGSRFLQNTRQLSSASHLQ